MPGYLVIDTETSGLFDFKQPADAPGQPRLAALAIMQVTDRLELELEHEYLVEPDGWTLDPEAAAVNGLTTDMLLHRGRPVGEVLDVFAAGIEFAHRKVLAWGAQFDLKMLRGEFRRAGRPDLFDQTPNACVMRAATKYCGIPQKNGRGLKWPTLEEACKILLGRFPTAPHFALGDARDTLEIARTLVQKGWVIDAKVHYAKNKVEAA